MKNRYESSIRQFQVQKIKLVKRETHAHFDRRAQVLTLVVVNLFLSMDYTSL